jgi:hypothetical protein
MNRGGWLPLIIVLTRHHAGARMKIPTLIVAIALATGMSVVSNAATAWRIGSIAQVQMDSHLRTGYQDAVWIFLPGSWTGVNCGSDWAWFNAKEDAHLLAQVLMARSSNALLRVYVDDSLPKLGVACHVMTVMSEGS